MKISVVIPTYNRKHTLSRALDSVLAQSYQPFEIIVIDDGSTDGTFDWIKSKYPSIKLLESLKPSKSLKGYSPKGVSVARNVGIKQSKGVDANGTIRQSSQKNSIIIDIILRSRII